VSRVASEPRSSSHSATVVVEHYISIVSHRVQVLMKRLEDVGRPKYASSSAGTLAEILIRILSCFFETLRLLHEEIDSQPPDDIIRNVQTIHVYAIKIIPELIEAVRMANSDSPTASIVEAYENLGDLIQYGTQAIIHPTWEYNASFDEIMTTLKTMTRTLGQDTGQAIFSGAPRSFVIITYPIAEEDMILRHAFIAHEIGHFIDSIEGWSRSLLEGQVFHENDRSCLREAVQGQREESDKEREYSEALTMAGAIVSSWIKEGIADFLAVCVLGPAYLLAFDEVSLSPKYSSPKRLSRSHPPGQLRKEIMGELIEELYWASVRSNEVFRKLDQEEQAVFSSVCEWIDAIVQAEPVEFTSIANGPDFSTQVTTAIYSVLARAVRRAIAKLKASQLDRIKQSKWSCTSEDIVDALRLQDLLSHGLTPTELYSDRGRDPSFAAIMNSGWFHFLHEKENYLYFSEDRLEGSSPDQVRDKYASLQNLVAKAVESLHFKREFLRRKGTHGEKNRLQHPHKK